MFNLIGAEKQRTAAVAFQLRDGRVISTGSRTAARSSSA